MTAPEYSGGRRNRYRKGMPWFERATKDVKSWWSDLFTPGHVQLLTYPDYPSRRTTIHKIARALPARLSNIPSTRTTHALYFHDATFKQFAEIPGLPEHVPTINGSCMDISKTRVDAVHQDVFGYNTFVDPLTHVGLAVEKSDENARHDGRIVSLPLTQPVDGAIYQVVIDNRAGEAFRDYRVVVMDGTVVLVYAKYKSEALRFTNEVHRSELLNLEVFSSEERRLIGAFTAAMHADFCELDVLRDNASGRIFAIDVNTTPYGPPAHLSPSEHDRAVGVLTAAFRQAFL